MILERKKLINGEDYIIKNESLIINEGVTIIPADSFKELYRKERITSIILPSTLVLIERSAFELSGFIKNLVIPDSVKYIMDSAFCHCHINNLTIGENVTYIGTCAFYKNYIESVTNNSEKLKFIDVFAFGDNKNLMNFNSNNKKKRLFIEESAFSGTGITNGFNDARIDIINIGKTFDANSDYYPSYACCFETTERYTYKNGVLKINEGIEVIGSFESLEDCTSIEMPNSVIIILPGAFNNLTKLNNIKMSNNIMVIGEDAFFGCNLEEKPFKMPYSLCNMNISAFKNDSNTNRILVPHNMRRYYSKSAGEFLITYDEYYNDMLHKLETYTKIIDIDELLESDRELLNSLNLLPETIEENKSKNSNSDYQSLILKKTLIDIISDPLYDETKNIHVTTKLLETKEIELSDMNDIVNILFENKQINTIYLLIRYGYDCTNNCMISRAIINNLYKMIDVLLLLKADINEIGSIEMYPLSIACTLGNYDLVKYLIEKGAAINKVDKNNKKAIDYALEYDEQEIVDLINSYNYVEDDETKNDIDILNRLLNK